MLSSGKGPQRYFSLESTNSDQWQQRYGYMSVFGSKRISDMLLDKIDGAGTGNGSLLLSPKSVTSGQSRSRNDGRSNI